MPQERLQRAARLASRSGIVVSHLDWPELTGASPCCPSAVHAKPYSALNTLRARARIPPQRPPLTLLQLPSRAAPRSRVGCRHERRAVPRRPLRVGRLGERHGHASLGSHGGHGASPPPTSAMPGHYVGLTITSERRSVLGSIILAFFSGQQGRPDRHGTAALGTSEVVCSGTGSSGDPHVVRLLSAGGKQQRVWVLQTPRAGAAAGPPGSVVVRDVGGGNRHVHMDVDVAYGEGLVPETDDAGGFAAIEPNVVAAPEDKAVNASTAVVSNSKLEPVSP